MAHSYLLSQKRHLHLVHFYVHLLLSLTIEICHMLCTHQPVAHLNNCRQRDTLVMIDRPGKGSRLLIKQWEVQVVQRMGQKLLCDQ